MPNHVLTEIVFESISPIQKEKILGLILNREREIDFEILLPIPKNCWMGSVGRIHQDTFPDNALDWCKKNWSTKWNAYGEHFVEYDGANLTLRFKTAWRTPYGWMCALFNVSELSFRYSFLDEGASMGRAGSFSFPAMQKLFGEAWKESEASQEETDRLGAILWGAEAYAEISAERLEP